MQNKKRFNKTNKQMNILKALMAFLMVIIVFFSMFGSINTALNIEKNINNITYQSQIKKPLPIKNNDLKNHPSPSKNKILQVPKIDNTYTNKLLNDINKLKYDPYIKAETSKNNFSSINKPVNNFSPYGSVSNGYHKGGHTFDTSHTFTFRFELKVNGITRGVDTWDRWLDDNDTSGWEDVSLNFNVANINPNDDVSIYLTRVYVEGDWDWDAELSMNPVSSGEAKSILDSYLNSSVISYSINDVTLHIGYDASNEDGWDDMNVEIAGIDKATFDITTNSFIKSTSSKYIFAKKIFMPYEDLKNKNFSLTGLKELVYLKDYQKNILVSNQKNRSLISRIKINDITKELEVTINKMNIGVDYYSPQVIKIPIILIDVNYLIQGSLRSSSYWEHLQTGETRYHSTKPSTILELNSNYIKSLYILFSKNDILNKVSSWNFIGGDKQVAIEKVNTNAINIFNYEEVKRKYSYNHNPIIFSKLQRPDYLSKYESVININNTTINDYLYMLKKSSLTFKSGVSILTNHKVNINSLVNGITISLTDQDIRNNAKAKFNTNWEMKISSARLEFPETPSLFKHDLNINLPDDNYQNYDLNLKYTKGKLKKSISHTYLYQSTGIDISNDITFIMEDGTLLNENYLVIRPSSQSKLKINDKGYVTVRYWATLNNNSQEYVTLKNIAKKWYSPKYQIDMIKLDPNFDIKKLEYVFNQELQMIINPYSNSSGQKPIEVVAAGVSPRYGIKVVSDELNGVKKELENWNDGLWSHSRDINGLPLFDGVFGADMNGMLDSKGRLESGLHKLNISLQNIQFKGLKQSFTIFIDKNPLNLKVQSPQGILQTLNLKDQNDNAQKLYFSNQPINFQIKDIDLKDVQAKFIDGNGNWYDLPINITSKMVDSKWVQTVSSTIDYAGFAKIIVSDQANNESITYFWLKQNNQTPIPKYDYDVNKLFNKSKVKFLNNNIDVFNDLTSIKISSPLVASLNISKMELVNGVWNKTKNNNNFIKSTWIPSSKNKSFGKTIDSSISSLKFAGDELKPFISKNNDKKWMVTNEIVDFKKPGLYKVNLQTNLIKNRSIDYYLYIKENGIIPLNIKNALTDLANLNSLPDKDKGDLDNIDKVVKVLNKIDVKFPNFLIKDYQVFYSLPWYSYFRKIHQPNLSFKKEGKYKILLTDIFNKKYEYEILLIDKQISSADRVKNHLTPLATPPPKLLIPYKDQLIFDNLFLDKELRDISFEFKTQKTGLNDDVEEDISKTIKLNTSDLNQIKPGQVKPFKIINNNDFNITNTEYSVWLNIKHLKNGLYRAWLYSESDGRNKPINNIKLITFVNQIKINVNNKIIDVFDDTKTSSALKNKVTWNRQALLLSGANEFKLKINDNDESDVTKDKYGVKNNQLIFDKKKFKMHFTLFNLDQNTKKDKSFYKGQNVWSYFRYEDEDHLIWERDEFIKGAMWNGLTWGQANKFYKDMKMDPKWNGDLGKLNWNEKDWQDKWKEISDKFKLSKLNPKNTKSNFNAGNSKSNTLTILIGTLTTLVLIIFIYVISKRIKGRKIR